MIIVLMFIKPRAAVALAALLAVTACSAPSAPAASGGATATDGPVIVVASYPLEYLASRLAPDAQVTNLVQAGAEPHDLELSAQQVQSVATANLVVYEKGFQPAVDDAISATTPAAAVDVSQGIDMVPLADEGDEHHGDEGADNHAEAPGQLDPHIWLDPERYAQMGATIAAALEEAFPATADATKANLTSLTNDLDALDQRFHDGLATCDRQAFVTTHAAFGYLASRYSLTQVAIDGLDPESEPSAARLAEVHQLAKEYGVTTIFYETLVPRTVAEQVAHDLNLKTDVLDPLEGITPDSRGTDYLSVMDANLTALRTANGCA